VKTSNRVTSGTTSRYRNRVLLGNVITRGHSEKEEKKWIIKLKVDIDTPIVVFSPRRLRLPSILASVTAAYRGNVT
jgi:hypothetical protein